MEHGIQVVNLPAHLATTLEALNKRAQCYPFHHPRIQMVLYTQSILRTRELVVIIVKGSNWHRSAISPLTCPFSVNVMCQCCQ
jgi:hypothetical protein